MDYLLSVTVLLMTLSFGLLSADNKDLDYSNKAKVKLSDVLKDNRKYRSETWPPENQENYFRVGVKLLGDKISTTFDANLKPTKLQMNAKKLKKLFWQYGLDQVWLSANKPYQLNGVMPHNNVNLLEEMNEAVKTLNFTFVDSGGTLLEIPDNMQKLFKNWLINYSSCQMNFVWEDLGEIFWPRWIRRGICTSSSSCSWPSGMACKYSGSRTLYLLRWVCERDLDGTRSEAHRRFMDQQKKKQRMKRKMYYYSQHKKRRRFRDNRRRRNRKQRAGGGEDKKRKRATRIIRLMSRPVNGHFCQWSMLKYFISDKCSCQCK